MRNDKGFIEDFVTTISKKPSKIETIQEVKQKTLAEILPKILPEPGEQFDFRGGLGNKIHKQIKNVDGIIYERENPNSIYLC